MAVGFHYGGGGLYGCGGIIKNNVIKNNRCTQDGYGGGYLGCIVVFGVHCPPKRRYSVVYLPRRGKVTEYRLRSPFVGVQWLRILVFWCTLSPKVVLLLLCKSKTKVGVLVYRGNNKDNI